NVAASGARHIAATNCLNFGSPEKLEVMWQFSQTIDGLGEACIALGTPITGGNVSFYNETLGKSIYPTPIIGILGLLEDSSHLLKIGFKNHDDHILLLDGSGTSNGKASVKELRQEFSSTEYAKMLSKKLVGVPPAIDLAAENRLINCLVALASGELVNSAHDVSAGGVAVCIAESCFGSNNVGAAITLSGSLPAEYEMFGEAGA